MAKSSPFSGAFNEKAFRSAVYGAMAMGIPEDPAQRVVFKWRREPHTRMPILGDRRTNGTSPPHPTCHRIPLALILVQTRR